MQTKLGTELNKLQQARVKQAFVYRYTGEHKPKWAHEVWKTVNGVDLPYPLQFKDDADWLANTRFEVNPSGSLDLRCLHCHSTPQWPNNPELRTRGQSQNNDLATSNAFF